MIDNNYISMLRTQHRAKELEMKDRLEKVFVIVFYVKLKYINRIVLCNYSRTSFSRFWDCMIPIFINCIGGVMVSILASR